MPNIADGTVVSSLVETGLALISCSCDSGFLLTSVAVIPTSDTKISGSYDEPIAIVNLPQSQFDNLARDLQNNNVDIVRVGFSSSSSDVKPVKTFGYLPKVHLALAAVRSEIAKTDAHVEALKEETAKSFQRVFAELADIKHRIEKDRALPNGRHSPLELTSQGAEPSDGSSS